MHFVSRTLYAFSSSKFYSYFIKFSKTSCTFTPTHIPKGKLSSPLFPKNCIRGLKSEGTERPESYVSYSPALCQYDHNDVIGS
ncbi:hypothetical protein GDO78_002673 [Eleutherodactylus coqui]|uniref:Uncharacterized protein n=1 Tax=Eleutherodactylus coqui TaxID=57060 RepID=A0A8J6EYC2_ELECQ|nr:hypothetical protein GDO78_002673 [Eleutherodactylus coqui]